MHVLPICLPTNAYFSENVKQRNEQGSSQVLQVNLSHCMFFKTDLIQSVKMFIYQFCPSTLAEVSLANCTDNLIKRAIQTTLFLPTVNLYQIKI
jgi:hypothetical protein